MIRLHFVVEGQTEERFVNEVLRDHLAGFNIICDARCVQTRRRGGRTYRGGMTSYEKAHFDIEQWLKEDNHPESHLTTMFDLYALPKDFPGWPKAKKAVKAAQKVEILESALVDEIKHPRFIPYLQLHEFEALILADPQQLDWEFVEDEEAQAISALVKLVEGFDSPEEIDLDAPPSKRIIHELKTYEGRKVSAGPLVVKKIGLPKLRERCPHFGQWLSRLEGLGSRASQAPPLE